jgi:hypothetical protein
MQGGEKGKGRNYIFEMGVTCSRGISGGGVTLSAFFFLIVIFYGTVASHYIGESDKVVHFCTGLDEPPGNNFLLKVFAFFFQHIPKDNSSPLATAPKKYLSPFSKLSRLLEYSMQFLPNFSEFACCLPLPFCNLLKGLKELSMLL